MSESPVVHSPRKLSFSKERALVSCVEEEQDQRKRQGAKPAEVYGFVGAISTIVAFVVYVIWAYAPESWLHSVGITYYPDRYWAVALPAFFIATIVFVLATYIALNHLSTPSPDSLNTVFDARTRDAVVFSSCAKDEQPIHPIADLPLVKINERMLT